jgi:putative ABC transport system permease protein
MIQDLRHSFRVLLQGRMVTLIAVLALGLGIGANTAIFSVVNAVLLSPLPYRDPARLVTLLRPQSAPISPGDFVDFRTKASSFEMVGAAEAWSAGLNGGIAPEQIVGLHLTREMFPLLGAAPVRGRTLAEDDFHPGKDRVLVISHRLWQSRFGGAADIVGRKVLLDNEAYTVIGVMGPEFRFAPFWITTAEMWAPLDLTGRENQRGYNSIRVFARLKPGVSIRTAQADVSRIVANSAAAYPEENAGMHVVAESLAEKSIGKLRPALELMLGAVGMVLLIACANVANLALARATARQREIAIRMSLGAQRLRIARQFLIESLMVSIAGAALGLVLAQWGRAVLQQMLRPDSGSMNARLAQWNQIAIDGHVLMFTLVLAVATGVLFGLAPAILASRGDVNPSLKDGGRGVVGGGGGRVRMMLVGAEIAIAFVLLAGAGLLMRSFVKLRAINPGFDSRNVMTMVVSVAGRPEYVGPAREVLYRTILERVRAVPGVRSASMTNHLPLAGDTWGTFIAVEGRPVPEPGKEDSTIYRFTRPDYFATMRVPMIEGRDFTDHDDASSPKVAIVNQALVRHLFPGEDPVGKRIALAGVRKNQEWISIVGVVADMKQQSWADEAGDEVHIPFLQGGQIVSSTNPWLSSMTLVARTGIDAERAESAIKSAVWSVDRNLPLSQVETLDHAIGNATWAQRSSLLLVGIFSGVALILVVIGIYGVMSYEVAQRTHEIGIRMALGAGRGGIVRMIANHSVPVTLIGTVCGLGLAVEAVRLMRTMLYQAEALDVATFAIVTVMILVVAMVAALIPARRAMKVDPMIALRGE